MHSPLTLLLPGCSPTLSVAHSAFPGLSRLLTASSCFAQEPSSVSSLPETHKLLGMFWGATRADQMHPPLVRISVSSPQPEMTHPSTLCLDASVHSVKGLKRVTTAKSKSLTSQDMPKLFPTAIMACSKTASPNTDSASRD